MSNWQKGRSLYSKKDLTGAPGRYCAEMHGLAVMAVCVHMVNGCRGCAKFKSKLMRPTVGGGVSQPLKCAQCKMLQPELLGV